LFRLDPPLHNVCKKFSQTRNPSTQIKICYIFAFMLQYS